MNSNILDSVNSNLLIVEIMLDFGTFLVDWRGGKGWSQAKLAEMFGCSASFISQLESGASKPPLDRVEQWADAMQMMAPGRRIFLDLALRSRIPEECRPQFDRILEGCMRDDERAAAAGRLREDDGVAYNPRPTVPLVGVAAAGKPTEAAAWQGMKNYEHVPVPEHWLLIKVTGGSAYPIAYPGQMVWVDQSRAVKPSTMNEDSIIDLHNNICLVQTIEDDGPKAYIKRLCSDARAPGGFLFASIDSGRGSPFLPLEIIELIMPIVGVWFEDPRLPRLKGRNRAEVTITV
jgi:transcriptional regulator with XRE-family HTH domain